MDFDRNCLFNDVEEFFRLQGGGVMKLTPGAALAACLGAFDHGLVIARIEGGIWHFPGFEARTDCIWDGIDPPVQDNVARKNNAAAAEFIREQSLVHDCFVLTAPSIHGWPHRRQSGN